MSSVKASGDVCTGLESSELVEWRGVKPTEECLCLTVYATEAKHVQCIECIMYQ